jgi:hypothetical protein
MDKAGSDVTGGRTLSPVLEDVVVGPDGRASICSGQAIPPVLELGRVVPPALPPVGLAGGNDAAPSDWFV